MRKVILLVSAVLLIAPAFAADAQTNAPLMANAHSVISYNSKTGLPTKHHAAKKPAPAAKTTSKTTAKTPAKTGAASNSSSAAVNTDPCNSGAKSAASTPNASASTDTSVQCAQDKAKPMQGGLMGH
jgi:hypothetical protein